jgi:UTP--glucose-1-phosphate uridylyltransferase
MTAIIPAAGKGTRFLPVTRAVPKEMLPVGAKPAIQLIVEEAIDAGADDVVIVISEEKEIIRRYFEGDAELSAKIRFVYQHEQKGLGHAVLQAGGSRNPGPVLVLLGDALVSGPNPSRAMAELSRAHNGASVVGLERVPPEKVSRYGIVKADAEMKISDLVEKPRPEAAPSDLAIAGRYLLDGAVFDLLATQEAGHGGEIQLTDSIRRLLADKEVYGYIYPGKRQDIGNPQGYFKALEAFNGNGQS